MGEVRSQDGFDPSILRTEFAISNTKLEHVFRHGKRSIEKLLTPEEEFCFTARYLLAYKPPLEYRGCAAYEGNHFAMATGLHHDNSTNMLDSYFSDPFASLSPFLATHSEFGDESSSTANSTIRAELASFPPYSSTSKLTSTLSSILCHSAPSTHFAVASVPSIPSASPP